MKSVKNVTVNYKNKPMTIAQFNHTYLPGYSINYRNEKGEVIEAKLRWPAERLGLDGRAVVWVEGRADAVDFNDVIYN